MSVLDFVTNLWKVIKTSDSRLHKWTVRGSDSANDKNTTKIESDQELYRIFWLYLNLDLTPRTSTLARRIDVSSQYTLRSSTFKAAQEWPGHRICTCRVRVRVVDWEVSFCYSFTQFSVIEDGCLEVINVGNTL